MLKHLPVLLPEVLEWLDIKEDGIYIDLTLGRGGHSAKILEKIPKGQLVCFDKDTEAIKESKNNLLKISNNFDLIHSDNRFFKDELKKINIDFVDGILVDLGVSSPQINEAERGFSYNKDARLDMRMDKTQKLDAHYIVNEWTQQELVRIFNEYANNKFANRIAKFIIANRPINTTLELVDILRKSLPAKVVRKKNPSKAIFQAIRIAVNNEMESLKDVLIDGITILKPGSKFAIITFHSVEDRIVKKFFGELSKDTTGRLPIQVNKQFSVKTIKPKKEEIEINNRSRSAKLRVLTKHY